MHAPRTSRWKPTSSGKHLNPSTGLAAAATSSAPSQKSHRGYLHRQGPVPATLAKDQKHREGTDWGLLWHAILFAIMAPLIIGSQGAQILSSSRALTVTTLAIVVASVVDFFTEPLGLLGW